MVTVKIDASCYPNFQNSTSIGWRGKYLKYYKNGRIDLKIRKDFIGYMRLHSLNEPGAYISEIRISDSHRNKGYGTFFLKLAEAIARWNKCTAIALYCQIDNKDALRFYLRNGYFIALTTQKGTVYYLLAKQLTD